MEEKLSSMLYNIFISNQIALSWGMHKFNYENPNILTFNVIGFLLTGKVSIQYKESSDLFNIKFKNKKNIIIKHLKGVYIEDLISTIDFVVEKNCSDKKYLEEIEIFYKNNDLFKILNNNSNIQVYE